MSPSLYRGLRHPYISVTESIPCPTKIYIQVVQLLHLVLIQTNNFPTRSDRFNLWTRFFQFDSYLDNNPRGPAWGGLLWTTIFLYLHRSTSNSREFRWRVEQRIYDISTQPRECQHSIHHKPTTTCPHCLWKLSKNTTVLFSEQLARNGRSDTRALAHVPSN